MGLSPIDDTSYTRLRPHRCSTQRCFQKKNTVWNEGRCRGGALGSHRSAAGQTAPGAPVALDYVSRPRLVGETTKRPWRCAFHAAPSGRAQPQIFRWTTRRAPPLTARAVQQHHSPNTPRHRLEAPRRRAPTIPRHAHPRSYFMRASVFSSLHDGPSLRSPATPRCTPYRVASSAPVVFPDVGADWAHEAPAGIVAAPGRGRLEHFSPVQRLSSQPSASAARPRSTGPCAAASSKNGRRTSRPELARPPGPSRGLESWRTNGDPSPATFSVANRRG